jgi:hypothetical protein
MNKTISAALLVMLFSGCGSIELGASPDESGAAGAPIKAEMVPPADAGTAGAGGTAGTEGDAAGTAGGIHGTAGAGGTGVVVVSGEAGTTGSVMVACPASTHLVGSACLPVDGAAGTSGTAGAGAAGTSGTAGAGAVGTSGINTQVGCSGGVQQAGGGTTNSVHVVCSLFRGRISVDVGSVGTLCQSYGVTITCDKLTSYADLSGYANLWCDNVISVVCD